MKITREFVSQLNLQPDSIYRIWLTNNNIPHCVNISKNVLLNLHGAMANH